MRTILRGLNKLLVAIGIVALLLVFLIGGALWLTLPSGHQQARIPGLSGPVDVTFDDDGVPRVRAGNERDGVAVLGYLHARDRMFQMELMRRAASGRLSEIAGPVTLPIDRNMRMLGLRHRASADFAALPADVRDLLEAYAAGVNARIKARGRFASPEFLILGAPEPWQPVDSLLWGKTMGLWLSANWRTELSRLALSGRVPDRLINQLWPPTGTPAGPGAALQTPTEFAAAARALAEILPSFPGNFALPASASNEWAVDGAHSATGAPLLAGDPHLNFGFPGIWYLARIELPDRVLAGATAPGVPAIVLGHNGQIAWTFTTTGADVQDVFVETPAGPGEYQTPDGPRPYQVREERIAVRGRPDEFLVVRETRHGPVVSDLRPSGNAVLAVAMGNLQSGDTSTAGLLALNRARTVEEAGEAATMISSPVMNVMVADRRTIGLFMSGRIPIRRTGDGSRPVPGDGSHDWIGWAKGEQLPRVIAPESGRLLNANERVAAADFPVFLGRDWFGDWRAERIRALLAETDRHTAAGFARMQVDVQSTFARAILPTLLSVPPQGEPEARLLALLRDWDGSMVMEAPQPLIFNAWVARFYRAVLRRAGIPLEHGGPMPDFVGFVLSDAGRHWCGGDCTPLLRETLGDTRRDLAARFGPAESAWRWGEAHKAVFAHPILRGIPGLGRLASASIASPGDDTTVNRGTPNASFQSVHGAAYRGVYDLANLDNSLFIVTPGQSGNPLSRHARDFLTRWRDGATITLGSKPDSVRATLRIRP
ncbi:MAG: penicillin acylase family protein [Acetobacteraceae bacterium]